MFHGSMVALVTPMDKDGQIDYTQLKALIEWHIQAGTSAIIIAGTTGESALLTDAEREQLFIQAVKIAKERIPIIAGTSSESTRHTIALSKQAMEAGVDACLIMTPAYIKPTQAGLYAHYKAVAEAVALPIILYNVPNRTACDLLPETIAKLSHISNIVGIKEATGDFERLKNILSVCGDSLDIYSGDDTTACELITQGAKGVISVTANIAPALMHNSVQAAIDGRLEEPDALKALHKSLFLESSPIPVKWALNHLGKIGPGIRLPLTPLAQAHHERLKSELAAIVALGN